MGRAGTTTGRGAFDRRAARTRRTASSQSRSSATRDTRGSASGACVAAGTAALDGSAATAGGDGTGGSDRGVAASTSAAVSGTPTKSTAARPAPGRRGVCDDGTVPVRSGVTRVAQVGQIPSVKRTDSPRHAATPSRRG